MGDFQQEQNAGMERRKYPRLNVAVEVEYNVISKGLTETWSSTKNIGAGGICLIVYEDVDVGSILVLRFKLPDARLPVETKGRIVWKKEFMVGEDEKTRYDVGIEFTEISESDREAIFKYVFDTIRGNKPKPKEE